MLRNIAGTENCTDLWRSLGYGRNVLDSSQQLDQYLYSYGLMIQSQWNQICCDLILEGEDFTLIDYGCGQGLASLLLLDNFGSTFAQNVKQVILVEPSSSAIVRAQGIVEVCYPNAEFVVINSDFDSLSVQNLVSNDTNVKIHLMSNILDIEGFDHFNLIKKARSSNKGTHYFIAVSHDRGHNGGSYRLEELYSAINELPSDIVLNSDLKRFTCDSGQSAIGFTLKLEL